MAHDPETIEIVETGGRRAQRRMLTTNVPHYRTFVFDAIERVRAGKPPLVSLADYVPVRGWRLRRCNTAIPGKGYPGPLPLSTARLKRSSYPPPLPMVGAWRTSV